MLARDEYADLRPGLLDRVWYWVEDALGRVLDLVGQTGQGGLIGSLVLLAVAALLVLGSVRLLSRVRRSPAAAGPEVGLAGRSAHDWDSEAADHEAAHRWREAARCRHRALVAALAAAGLVEEVPGRTAAEYEAEATASVPAAGEPMRRATRLFERAWYARSPVTGEDVGDLRRAADEVRRAAGLRLPAGRP